MELQSPKHNPKIKIIFVIFLLATSSIIIYMLFQMNYLKQQLVNKESQLLELRNYKNILERKLQETDLKLAALTSANSFLEKNNERLGAIRDFLKNQLDMINEQLARQQEIIDLQQEIVTSLKEANSKLDTVISQIGYLYLSSPATSPVKGRNKAKVNVILTPKQE
jgi:chromosome segregation ATPase